ncbi:MAG TPA: GNAT family N-acetyltransferase [Trebonia sp.]|nr:GNAT family N-acetyltransferase [Trebonia sp.]
MTDDDLLLAYDEQMRTQISHSERPGLIIERDGPLLRVAGDHRGFVTGPRDLGLDGEELDALIARQRDYFQGRGEAFEWKTRAHDLPADLPDRLRAAGFIPEETETLLVGLADEMTGDGSAPDGVTLSQVTSEADFRAIGAMESQVWGQDWSFLADGLIERAAAAPDDIAVFAVRDNATGEVVSAAWIVFYPGTDFAGLWGGSTVKAWRSRGIYRALVAVRARLAVARGLRYLQVDASDESAPILRRLGFHALTTTTPYIWTPTA